MSVAREIVELISSELDIATTPDERLGIDSLEFICLLKAIEGKYGIKIGLRDAQSFETVQQIADYISGRIVGSPFA